MPSAPEHIDFRDQVCLPMLTLAQNSDGGWGYQQGKQSATEPTAWALLALSSHADSKEFSSLIGRGKDWLRSAQLPDHSWPAFAKFSEGCWLTSLAGLALHQLKDSTEAVAARRKMAVQRMASRRQTVAALAAADDCPAEPGASKRGLARLELDSRHKQLG